MGWGALGGLLGINVGGPGQRGDSATSTTTTQASNTAASGATITSVAGNNATVTDAGAIHGALDIAHEALAANGNLANQVITAAGSALGASVAAAAQTTVPDSVQLQGQIYKVVLVGTILLAAVFIFGGRK